MLISERNFLLLQLVLMMISFLLCYFNLGILKSKSNTGNRPLH